MTKFHPLIASLWALSGAGAMVMTWNDEVRSGIQLAYLALTAIGGAAILLYQKKLSVDREDREVNRSQEDRIRALAMEKAMDEVHARLDAVISQRDHESRRADQLFKQLQQLAENTQKLQCIYPVDGVAGCKYKEQHSDERTG